MARPYFVLLALLVTSPATLAAQPRAPQAKKSAFSAKPATAPAVAPTIDSLAAITRRGRALAQYDRAAWLASGAMTSSSSQETIVRRLISRETDRGWEVASGELSEAGDVFLVSVLARPGMQTTWASQPLDPPQADSGYYARAGRAIATALVVFHPIVRRPHIATAVPADDGPWWWVYVYPGPLEEGGWPRGGDMRFRVSADGRVVTDARRLHDEISEYSVRTARSAGAPPDKQPIVQGDVPEDTDVFHVLQRRPALPELMTAGRYRYRIDVDGSIRLLGLK